MRLVEAAESGERLDEGLLRGVVREAPIRGHGVRRTSYKGPVAVEERAGSLRGTLAGQRDELDVRAATHFFF